MLCLLSWFYKYIYAVPGKIIIHDCPDNVEIAGNDSNVSVWWTPPTAELLTINGRIQLNATFHLKALKANLVTIFLLETHKSSIDMSLKKLKHRVFLQLTLVRDFLGIMLGTGQGIDERDNIKFYLAYVCYCPCYQTS